MLTYDQVIAGTAGQQLNLGRPRLRLLPPPEPLIDHPVEPSEIMAWAKAKRARGEVFVGVPVPPPPKEPKPRRPSATQSVKFADILRFLPATLDQLTCRLDLSRSTIYPRLQKMRDEGLVQSIRPTGQHAALIWRATPQLCKP
jgi:hypothetical protein